MASLRRPLVWILPALAAHAAGGRARVLAGAGARSRRRSPRHGAGRPRRPAGSLGLPAHHPRAGRSRHRLRRPPRRPRAQSADRQRGGQRHVDRGRDRSGAAALSRAHPRRAGRARAGRRADGARVRSARADLPAADHRQRRVRNSGHEVWDVSDPAKPPKAATVVTGLTSTHKNWWECDTGIAYLISGDLAKAEPLQVGASGWRTGRMTKIYDLSDPAKPRLRPRLRSGRPGAGLDRAGPRPARRARAHRAGQPRVLRVRHQHRRRAADRGSPEAARRARRSPRRRTSTRPRSAGSTCRPTGAATRRSRCWG